MFNEKKSHQITSNYHSLKAIALQLEEERVWKRTQRNIWIVGVLTLSVLLLAAYVL